MEPLKRVLRGRVSFGLAWIVWATMVLIPQVLGVELKTGPHVEVGARQAIVRWETDVPAAGRLHWGTHPHQLRQRLQGPTGTRHEIVLNELIPGTRYFFTVGTARYPLGTNSFTTLSADGTVSSNGVASAPPTNALPVAGGTGAVSGSGGASGSPAAMPQAPPARVTWGSYRTLQDHFDRHGPDFGAKDPEDYARMAWQFLQRAKREGLPAKRDDNGVLRIYDPATRAFGAYNRNGTTRTYFKPGRRDYFRDQPGRPVDLKQER